MSYALKPSGMKWTVGNVEYVPGLLAKSFHYHQDIRDHCSLLGFKCQFMHKYMEGTFILLEVQVASNGCFSLCGTREGYE